MYSTQSSPQIIRHIFTFIPLNDHLDSLDLVSNQFHRIISDESDWKSRCEKLSWAPKGKKQLFKNAYITHMKTCCHLCGKKTLCISVEFKRKWCQTCRKTQTMMKTDCKALGFSDENLNRIRCEKVRFHGSTEMCLYLRYDIQVYLKKHPEIVEQGELTKKRKAERAEKKNAKLAKKDVESE